MSIRIPPTPSVDSVGPSFISLAEILRQSPAHDPFPSRPTPPSWLIGALGFLGLALHVFAASVTHAPQSSVAQFVALATKIIVEGACA